MNRNYLITISLSFTLAVIAVIFNTSHNSRPKPCKEPLTYHIASIGSRYDISEDQLRKVMREVEELWTTALSRSLFKFSEDGQIAIHLIYSENQQETRAERRLSRRIESQKKQFDILYREFQRLSDTYDKRKNKVKALLSNYNLKVDDLNNRFLLLRDDGISQAEERFIKQEKRQLKKLKYRVDQKHAELKSQRKRLVKKSRWVNKLSAEINELITAYNNRFSEPRKFHQGRYIRKNDQQVIKIFQFGNIYELKTVLAHEMGHALGLDHVETSESVMYYLLEKQNMVNLSLSKEDIEAIKNQCENYSY